MSERISEQLNEINTILEEFPNNEQTNHLKELIQSQAKSMNAIKVVRQSQVNIANQLNEIKDQLHNINLTIAQMSQMVQSSQRRK